MATCKECRQPIIWKQVEGRWKAMEPDGPDDPNGPVEHFMVCASDDAKRRRTRMGLEPGVFAVSMSRIRLYRTCPRAYSRRYLEHIPEPKTPAMELGSLFHRYVEQRLRGEAPEQPPVPLEFVDDWARMVATFERGEWTAGSENLVGLEERIEYEWQDEAVKVAFEAIADMLLIEGRQATIVDWKTGFDVPSEAALRTDVQARAYALVAFRRYPQLRHVHFQQVHFRFGGRVVGVDFEPDEVDEFEAALKAEVGVMMRDTVFAPSPACQICPPGAHQDLALELYRDVSIQASNGDVSVTIAPIDSQAAADKFARGARFADVIASALKAQLRDWTRDNGPAMATASGGYGHVLQEERHCSDILTAIELLTEHGLDVNDYVRLDLTACKPLLGDGRKGIPELAELIDVVPATRFTWKPKMAEVEEE